MRDFTATLLDVDGPSSVSQTIDAQSTGCSLSGATDWSIHTRTLRGGLSEGVLVVDLCSGPLTVSILPTRGMAIWKAECDGVPVGWSSPVRRPVHPTFVDLGARNGLGWLDGFNELLCRCGLAFNGPPGLDEGAKSPVESQVTLHGRIANIPAHRVTARVEPNGRISVTGEVDECVLFGPQLRLTSTVSVLAGGRTIEIEDRVRNLASGPNELELLYHINVGPPFLDGGATLHTAAAVVAPRDPRAAEGIESYDVYLPPTPGYAEQAYFFDPLAEASGESSALLRNANGDRGFGVTFEKRGLPCLTVWKCTQAEPDGYVTGLEPGTNYPNFKSFERRQGRVISLQAGGEHVCRLRLDVLTSEPSVAAMQQKIDALQAGRQPVVHRAPAAGFSPVG
jgi:hypothetical protein